MKNIFISILAITFSSNYLAQLPGDTIKVKAFKYGSTTRDTMLNFPGNNFTYEKIILKYNMRCKNALISNQTFPNQGCGEWDYSCNTYLVDSSKIEDALNTQPKYVISNFSGTNFNYTNQTPYDYYNFNQTNVAVNNIISETQYTLGTGVNPATNLLKSNEKSGKSQVLYTAAELISAGITAGNIDGLILNVANAGGGVNFLKVGVQQTTLATLNSASVTITGFTNVYNRNYSFTAGNNRIQFYTPFVWNGSSNLLFEFSFTNTNPTNPVIFNGAITASNMALYAKNNYALDLSALGHATLNTAMLGSINNEITVSFWAFGNSALMPSNTSLLYGYGTNPNQRSFNLHLPWSDNNIYFDCGNVGGNFDRINKLSAAADQGGQWNHWTFTKNAVTGDMKIYLNGTLWHSGTGYTKTISILGLILGKDKDFLNNYKGKINELTIWNKELTITDIQNWMNKSIDATHPFYANLLAYYKMNEGTGLTINDSKNNLISTGVNLQWTYDRGNQLTRTFSETNIRPNIVFVRGNYSLTTTTLTVKDSLARNPNVVQQYSITSNAGILPMTDDVVNLISTSNLFQSTPVNIYNGDTGVLTGTLAVSSQSTITLSNLSYFKRYPFFNEMTSFVTPYGKGLDLGALGKTWYFDVSDFAPILKGKKRFLMTLGGENQEQMDLDFWFIVGTPPRNVLEFNQLWQGAARAGGAGIASVNNNSRFPVLSVPILSNGQYFKLRSTITGHGAQGEFHQNGGIINHFFNVNGGPNEFTWPITEECGFNPVFPQGGTWLYDRQGWCPGQSSLLKEYNLTPHITPGTTVTLDYGCSNPPNPSGDYRFLVANQLITYGGANHNIDASIVDVLAPSNKVLYSRSNPVCANPLILVRNTGSTALTSIEIDYWLNNAQSRQTYTWTGNLAFMDTAKITLPIGSLWQNDPLVTGNKFNVELKKANAVPDQYTFNNYYSSPFNMSAKIPSQFSIEFRTNNYPQDNTYKIVDESGNVIFGASPLVSANTTYTDSYELNGCFKLIVTDATGDGLQWWANTSQGAGSVKIKNTVTTGTIKTFEPDFGNGFEYSFTAGEPVLPSALDDYFGTHLNLYPNPAHSKVVLESDALDKLQLRFTDILGHQIEIPTFTNNVRVEFNTESLNPGVYFIIISRNNTIMTKKVIIN